MYLQRQGENTPPHTFLMLNWGVGYESELYCNVLKQTFTCLVRSSWLTRHCSRLISFCFSFVIQLCAALLMSTIMYSAVSFPGDTICKPAHTHVFKQHFLSPPLVHPCVCPEQVQALDFQPGREAPLKNEFWEIINKPWFVDVMFCSIFSCEWEVFVESTKNQDRSGGGDTGGKSARSFYSHI